MRDEQSDIIREAAAYRFPYWTIGVIKDRWMLEVRATLEPSIGSRPIWGPHLFGTGTYNEMNKLRRAAMATYNKTDEGEAMSKGKALLELWDAREAAKSIQKEQKDL